MKEKPFFNIAPIYYWHTRSKYNPMRFIFGEKYLSKKAPEILFETSDISFMSLSEMRRILSFNDFEWGAYVMDKKGRKPRPSFSNNCPEGVRD